MREKNHIDNDTNDSEESFAFSDYLQDKVDSPPSVSNRYSQISTKTNCPSCGAPVTFNYQNPSDVCPFCYNTVPQFQSLIFRLRAEKTQYQLDLARQKQQQEANYALARQKSYQEYELERQRSQQEHERSMSVIREDRRREKRRAFARNTGSCCGTVLFKAIFGLLLGIAVLVGVILYLPKILEYAITYKLSLWSAILKAVAGK